MSGYTLGEGNEPGGGLTVEGEVEKMGEKSVCLELDLEKKLMIESIGENISFGLECLREDVESTLTFKEEFLEPRCMNG